MDFAALVENLDRAVLGHLGGVSIVFQPEAGAAVPVKGIFDPRYVLSDQGNSDVEQVSPAVWLKLSDLPPHPFRGRPLVIVDGVTYNVQERRTDGQLGGSVVLILKRAVV